MATLRSLIVNLIARTEVFDQNLRKATSTLRAFRKDYLDVARSAFAIAVVTDAVGDLTSALVEMRDKGFGAGLDKFVKGMPVVGGAISKASDSIAELIVNTSALDKQLRVISSRASAVDSIATKFDKLEKAMKIEIGEMETPISERNNKVLREYQDRLSLISQSMNKLWKVSGRVPAAIPMLMDLAKQSYLLKLDEPFKKLNAELQKQIDLFDATHKQIVMRQALDEGITKPEQLDALSKQLDMLQELEDERQANIEWMEAEEKYYDDLISSVERYNNAMQNFADSIQRQFGDPIENLMNALDMLDAAFEQGRISLETYNRAYEGMIKEAEGGKPKQFREGEFSVIDRALVSLSSLQRIGGDTDREQLTQLQQINNNTRKTANAGSGIN